MENFANYNEQWIKENGRRWEKAGRIRYYFNSIWAIFDLLGIEYSFYKTGNICHVEGYSNTQARRMAAAFDGSYYDAVTGKWHIKCRAIEGEMIQALCV